MGWNLFKWEKSKFKVDRLQIIVVILRLNREFENFDIVIIQLSPEGEVNSGGYIPRREASRSVSTALHRP